ncbi:thiamine pyrophosphate-binding protein [Rummeliibacillus pycnus]|uniref:thiamine pyrophosphate-binding protein n=1 Tax=Rummeliibacillus pycnus TaxID=101070 RepID=UPI003D2D7C59
MKKTVANLLIEHLRKFGVQYVYGIPGKPIVPLILEMDRCEMPFILARHEAGAGFMASGYALQNNTFGVALGTSGPGGTNMLTAAGQAMAFHLPVIFITGHPSIKETGTALGQDSTLFGTDLVKMFEPVTRFSARVERGDLFPIYFQHAIEKAISGNRGPVHLSIPSDVLLEEIEPFDLELPKPYTMVSNRLDEALSVIEKANSPLLFVGKGVHLSHAYEEIKELSIRFDIPIITTPGGKGAVRTDHPGYLGPFGLGGTKEAAAYLKSGVDLLIVVGTKLSDMTLAGFSSDMYPKQILQFDIDPTFVGKSLPIPTFSVIGDAKDNLKALLAKIQEVVKKESALQPITYEKSQDVYSSKGYILASKAVQVLREQLPPETVVFGDDGSHSFYAIQQFDIQQEGTFYFDDVFGSMGNGIGFSIGAKMANPETPIVCLTGDGCTLMFGTEISTAVCHNVQVIFVVFNNGRLDMVDKGMRHNVGRAVGTVYEVGVDVQLFAESLGATSFKCRKEEDIEKAIVFGLQNQGPTVLEVIVDPDEVPPTMSRG